MSVAHAQIRILDSTAFEDYRQHLLRLDAQSRHARFGWAMDDAGINAHSLRVTSEGAAVIGAYIDGTLRGGVELWPAGERAEIVFSVEKDWRRLGLGTALIERAVGEAAQQGLTAVEVDTDEFGPAAMSLVRKFATGSRGEDGRVKIAIPQAA